MKKCLHCERPVDFISSKGWVHMPEGRAYVMEHEIMDEKRLKNYNIGMPFERSKGCGWIGVQPTDAITWDTDTCPKCGVQGELEGNHIASPSHAIVKDIRIIGKNRETIDKREGQENKEQGRK